MQLSAM